MARLLAWIKGRDLAPLGFPTFRSFCIEHVDWGASWLGQLIRLTEADLPQVKAAVCTGQLPLAKAVRAPRETDRAGEASWLERVFDGDLPWWERDGNPGPSLTIIGPDVALICEARDRARLILGRPVGDDAADAFVRECWEQRRTPAEILETARETPPAPEPVEIPTWTGVDPATALVGPWTDPLSLDEALARLDGLKAERRLRIVELGQLYAEIRDHHWVWMMGFDSRREMVRSVGMSLRTMQRYAHLVDCFALHPALAVAFESGMDLGRLQLVADIAEETTVDDWIALARRVPIIELRAAIVRAEAVGSAQVFAMYAGATNTVALAGPAPKAVVPAAVHVPVIQVEAARWFVDNVQIEPRRGFGRVADRDGHTCQNPRCDHRSLRVHAHHVVYRCEGGSDELDNGIALCSSCHLRIVHPGHATVRREGSELVWRYVGGDVIRVR